MDDLGDWILILTKPANRNGHHRNNRKRSGLRSRGAALAMTVLAMQANATIATERITQFDTDSETIGIDNRCPGCISHIRDDFLGTLGEAMIWQSCEGIRWDENNERANRHIGWSWNNEFGRKHSFTVPNSYYVPDGRVRLLSPQHWAQTRTKGPQRDQCGKYTNGRECVIFGGGGTYKMRIPLGKRDPFYAQHEAALAKHVMETGDRVDAHPISTRICIVSKTRPPPNGVDCDGAHLSLNQISVTLDDAKLIKTMKYLFYSN